MVSLDEFIRRSVEVHGDLYNYDKVSYTNVKDSVEIYCNKHKVYFKQSACEHYSKRNRTACPHCVSEKLSVKRTTSEFIIKSRFKHGDKFDYSKVEYKGTKCPVTLICKKHGEFTVIPDKHLNRNQGCPKCLGRTFPILGKDLNKILTKKYPDVVNTNIIGNVIYNGNFIIERKCTIHNKIYKQSAKNSIYNKGCQECKRDVIVKTKRLSFDDFVLNSKLLFGDKYEYDSKSYTGSKVKTNIFCKKHGWFKQRPNDHLMGHTCKKCSNSGTSKAECELTEFIRNYTSVIEHDRKLLDGTEVDLYLPEFNIGIEYCGLYWHSDKFKNYSYHVSKTDNLELIDKRLITIFEDEWLTKTEIVKSILLSNIGKSMYKIYGRCTELKEIDNKTANLFLNNNHLQGTCSGSNKINLGLYHKGVLVSVMVFCKPRLNTGNKKSNIGEWELLRFCNILNTNVIGAASKLYNYFINMYTPKVVTSYCDRRWYTGKMYEKLGLKLVEKTKPSYSYFKNSTKRINRFSLRRSVLLKKGMDNSKTTDKITSELGYNKIYDCGTYKYRAEF